MIHFVNKNPLFCIPVIKNSAPYPKQGCIQRTRALGRVRDRGTSESRLAHVCGRIRNDVEFDNRLINNP